MSGSFAKYVELILADRRRNVFDKAVYKPNNRMVVDVKKTNLLCWKVLTRAAKMILFVFEWSQAHFPTVFRPTFALIAEK